MANVGDHQKRRPAVFLGQRLGVAFRLPARALHGQVPAGGAYPSRARLGAARVFLAEQRGLRGIGFWLLAFLDALLGLANETAALIEVDEAGAGAAVRVLERDGFVEDVIVGGLAGLSGLWFGGFDERGQLAKEELIIGALRPAGFRPALDEGVDV